MYIRKYKKGGRLAKLKKAAALMALCAILVLPGCTSQQSGDPLADYGADAALPQIDRDPTPEPDTPAPSLTPTPAAADWAELPMDESAPKTTPAPRPTRRPTPASMDAQLGEFIRERENSEIDNTGTLQANAMSGGMALEFTDAAGSDYLYFTAADGRLYRQIRMDGAPVTSSWEPADAQAVASDRAEGLMRSLGGDLLYTSGGRLLRLADGDGARREVLCSFDEISCLTRWDDTIMFIARTGDDSGVYALTDPGLPEMIVPSARAMQFDVVERRIIVMDSEGLKAYSLDGDLISPMITCDMSAFCYSGGSLYYSTGGAIYRLMPGGAVERVLDAGATWIGCMGDDMFYISSFDGSLRRCGLDGADDCAVSDGPAYNPTLLSDRIVYATEIDGGIDAEAVYLLECVSKIP